MTEYLVAREKKTERCDVALLLPVPVNRCVAMASLSRF